MRVRPHTAAQKAHREVFFGGAMSGSMLSADATVIRMDGVFDVPAAQRLARAVAAAGDRDVVIDLTHVREFHDFGVALLARELASRGHTSVSGLRQHQLRLLRYLGLDPRPADAAGRHGTA